MTRPMSVLRRTARASIGWTIQHADGPSFGFDNARIECSKCDGWTGTSCPNGCGVRLISTQAEDDAAYRERAMHEAEERKAYREARRRERDGRNA